ncbi:MAG TPA: acyl-CoA dehydrogenase family protein [Acidimicrobiia bacterium]|nr:acyl-CoA dehydrogenase family protein [Acidimicrobiia bacterium]
MDTRDTAEQAELRRAARQLAHDLGPATVRDLDDQTRRQRLAGAVRDAGWLELRDDAGNGSPLASGVEACIVAEALGAAVADVPFSGPILAADLARRAGVTLVPGAVVAFGADLVGTGEYPAFAVDAYGDVDAVHVVVRNDEQLQVGVTNAGAIERATDLTRVVRAIPPGSFVADITGHLDADDVARWTALGLALTSADLVGVMRGAIDVTVAYAAERKQYGVAIGSFQAVQHLLAEAAALCEGAVSVALHASWAVDDLAPADALTAGRVAKAYCARAARTVCETAIQVHGGIGNTWDCIAHVYLRRALLSARWFGDDAVQLRALERDLVGVADGFS